MKSSPEEKEKEIEELKKRLARYEKNGSEPIPEKKEKKITNRVVGVGKMMAGVTMLAFAPYIAQGGAAVMGLGLAVTALGGAAWVGGFAIKGIGKLAGKGDDHWSQRYGAALQNVGAKTAIVGVGIAGVGAAMIASPVVGAGLALEGAYQTKSGKKPSFGIGPMVDIARNAARGAFRGIDNKYPIDIGKNRTQAGLNLENNDLKIQSNLLNDLNKEKLGNSRVKISNTAQSNTTDLTKNSGNGPNDEIKDTKVHWMSEKLIDRALLSLGYEDKDIKKRRFIKNIINAAFEDIKLDREYVDKKETKENLFSPKNNQFVPQHYTNIINLKKVITEHFKLTTDSENEINRYLNQINEENAYSILKAEIDYKRVWGTGKSTTDKFKATCGCVWRATKISAALVGVGVGVAGAYYIATQVGVTNPSALAPSSSPNENKESDNEKNETYQMLNKTNQMLRKRHDNTFIRLNTAGVGLARKRIEENVKGI